MTLIQTALGGGVLTLAYAMRLTGVGLGVVLLVILSGVGFIGVEILLRAGVSVGARDTTELLTRCVGNAGSTAMDVFLTLFGFGAMISYFILLGDFLPSIVNDACLWVRSSPLMLPHDVLRTRCMLATLMVIVPLSIPHKLSALRYVTLISLVAIVVTSSTIIMRCPGLNSEHQNDSKYGEVEWGAVGNWGVFQAYSIFLFAYNCHLNVVSVATEFQRPTDPRIFKACLWLSLVLLVFYTAIAVGGYLSFAEFTAQNILNNYASSPIIVACRLMFSCTLTVGVATYLNPTVRALQGVAKAFTHTNSAAKQPLLQDGTHASDAQSQSSKDHEPEILRFVLIAFILSVTLIVGILVPNVADVIGFVGASVGTGLMMLMPTLVLFKATPPGFSRQRVLVSAAVLLGAAAMAGASVCVMFLQKIGTLPA